MKYEVVVYIPGFPGKHQYNSQEDQYIPPSWDIQVISAFFANPKTVGLIFHTSEIRYRNNGFSHAKQCILYSP